MQLYAVNFIPLLGSLYMFRVFYTPIIRSTIFNCIYSHRMILFTVIKSGNLPPPRLIATNILRVVSD